MPKGLFAAWVSLAPCTNLGKETRPKEEAPRLPPPIAGPKGGGPPGPSLGLTLHPFHGLREGGGGGVNWPSWLLRETWEASGQAGPPCEVCLDRRAAKVKVRAESPSLGRSDGTVRLHHPPPPKGWTGRHSFPLAMGGFRAGSMRMARRGLLSVDTASLSSGGFCIPRPQRWRRTCWEAASAELAR